MEKQQALDALSQLKPELIKRFGVTRLALFGSTVRGEAKEGSDMTLLFLLMAVQALNNFLVCSSYWKMS